MEFATSVDDESFRTLCIKINAKPHVHFKLFCEPFAELAACHVFSLTARKRGVVDEKRELDGRLVYFYRLQKRRIGVVRDGVADVDVWKARHHGDVTRFHSVRIGAGNTGKGE